MASSDRQQSINDLQELWDKNFSEFYEEFNFSDESACKKIILNEDQIKELEKKDKEFFVFYAAISTSLPEDNFLNEI